MSRSKWTKTNSSEIVRASHYTNRAIPTTHPTLFYAGAAFTTIFAYVQILQTDFSTLALPFGIVIAIGTIAFARHLNTGGTYNLRRALKLPYSVAEPALYAILSDMGVDFTRKINRSLKTHVYELATPEMTVRITRYDRVLGVEHGLDDVSSRMVVDSPGVLVTLHNVSDSNQAFAAKLTSAIDSFATGQLAPVIA